MFRVSVNSIKADVAVIVALKIEFDALTEVTTDIMDGEGWERFEDTLTRLPLATARFKTSEDKSLNIIVAQAAGMGAAPAAAITGCQIDRYQPTAVAMTGVCAGNPDKVNLGDVIVADKVYYYDHGKKVGSRILAEHKVYNLPRHWSSAIEKFDFPRGDIDSSWLSTRPISLTVMALRILKEISVRYADGRAFNPTELETYCAKGWSTVLNYMWRQGYLEPNTLVLTKEGVDFVDSKSIEYPELNENYGSAKLQKDFSTYHKPIATGTTVVQDGRIWGTITKSERKTIGVEMEAAAVAEVVDAVAYKPKCIIVKGVMDFGDDGKDDQFKHFAARASAEYLIAFLCTRDDIYNTNQTLADDIDIHKLHLESVMEMYGVLKKSWSVEDASRYYPNLSLGLSLMLHNDRESIKQARKLLRPFLGSGVSQLLPFTREYLEQCRSCMSAELAEIANLFR